MMKFVLKYKSTSKIELPPLHYKP